MNKLSSGVIKAAINFHEALSRVCWNRSLWSESNGENSETDAWLDFAFDCGYLPAEDHKRLATECREVGAMLGSMLNKPEQFLIKDIEA